MFAFRNVAAILLSAFFLAAAAHAAGPKQFFKPLAAAKSARMPDQVSEPVAVQWNSEEMLKLRPGEEVSLALPGLVTREVVFERSQDHGGGIHSWVGHFKERGIDNRVIVTSGPGGSYGVIESPDGIYRIIPGDGTHDWLVDLAKQGRQVTGPVEDDSLVPPQAPQLPAAPSEILKVTPTPQTTIDLMVVLTQGLANKLGINVMTRMLFLVTRANQAYSDSEIAITLRLVKVAVVNYSDTTTDSAALNAVTPVSGGGTGVFASIETQRAAAGADVVSFMRDGSSFGGSGLAWVGIPSPNPVTSSSVMNASYMYSVVTGCVAGCESVFIHEVGHNMGNRHDRYTNAWQNGGTTGAANPFAYGYAYCETGALTCTPTIATGTAGACPGSPSSNQPQCAVTSNNNFRDIMAYFQASTQEVYRFSNPNISCKTANGDGALHPCGIAQSDTANAADTAASMNITRDSVARVQTQVSAAQMPGSLQFKQPVYSGAESAGSITFTVSRVRDSTLAGGGGVASVTYTVTGATAIAGVDFTASSGTLSWADGDFGDKSFAVPLIVDALVEGSETFNVALSNPTGSAGIFLGYPSTAVGLITETWPPSGLMPAGFVTAGSGGWATATDQAFEGTTSLRSAQVVGNGDFSTYFNSDLTYTATIPAGQGAFAYRVSSYGGYGFLEFSLDGTVLLSATGETGWQAFAFTVPTSGVHTLMWRYKNRLGPQPCNAGWIPPAEGGASCADRAWIDALSLPQAATPVSTTALSASTLSTTTTSSVTLTATVSGSAGAPTGTVTFTEAASTLGTATVTGGVATLVLPSLSVGTHTITASYAGDSSYTASISSPVSIVVAGAVSGPHLGNISTRMQVLTGNDVMIGGFVIGGSASKTVAIVATGPSLTAYGIMNALADPTLQLVRSSDQAVIATNDNWASAANAGLLQAAGFAPSNPLESAILVTLAPGAYTAIVQGNGGGTGVGIVAVYEVDNTSVPLVNISTRGRVLTGNDVMIGGFVVQGSGPQNVVVVATGPSLAAYGIVNPLANPTLTLVRSSDQAVLATNDDWQSAPNATAIQAAGFAPSNARESAIMMSLPPGAYTAIVSGVGGGTGVGVVAVYTVP